MVPARALLIKRAWRAQILFVASEGGLLAYSQLRLTPDQLEAKRALEAAVEEVKQDLEVEEDADKKDALKTELKDREMKLEGLMEQFEVRTCDYARSCHIELSPKNT